jgi:heme-degrading monooxygenase HmoA
VFIAIWEFTIDPRHRAAFERAYASDGDWARLFRHFPGYHHTDLLHNADQPDVYVTVDCWDSEAQLKAATQSAEYRELDRRCESFTLSERRIGGFEGDYTFLVSPEAPRR